MLQHWYVNVMLCLIVVVMLLWLSLSHDRVDDQKHISNHDRTIRRLRAMHHEVLPSLSPPLQQPRDQDQQAWLPASAVATAGMRRCRLGDRNNSTSTGIGGGSSNMLRFYTDDAPGLKISPTVVLVMSLCFIGFVTALHVFGKLYRSKSGGTV
ncbi:Protein transport protein Sec61 subunit beta [Glycine soja]|nr:Protein transport protein Sec61 subunit beta [Glycine soja]